MSKPVGYEKVRGSLGRITSMLEGVFAQYDKALEAMPDDEKKKIVCKKGCDHCCYIVNLICLSEALLIAKRVLANPGWKGMLPKLKEAAIATSPNDSRAKHCGKRIPCPFLVDSQCSIYDVRPSSCRYYFVLGSSSQCANGGDVISLDTLEITGHIFQIDNEIFNGETTISPLPLMVLYALNILSDEIDIGIPHPDTWIMQAMTTWDGDQFIKARLSGEAADAMVQSVMENN